MAGSIEDFQTELLNDVDLAASAEGGYRENAFFQIVCDHLVAAGELETHERTGYFDRGVRIDGHGGNPDDADKVLSLIVLDFDPTGGVASLTATDVDAAFKRLTNFATRARDASYRFGLEESSAAFEAAVFLNTFWPKAGRVKLILISNRRLSARVDGRESTEIEGKHVAYSVWDLDRLWQYVSSGQEREDMVLDLETEYGGAIPALPAHLGFGDYEAMLCVVPGEQIAEIYGRWGSRLLEQNVRSFLQLKGNVNKGIAKTIKETPERFFAYNNGITATAEEVALTPDGRSIARIRNLQIVNGGQTTASLSLQHGRGESLKGVFVQMKLSIVKPELAEQLVPKISEYANTQNKVNAADFFANHPFHIELEKLSRATLAPAREGSFTQTRWFYERSRGQFQNERNRVAGAAQKRFDAEWPKGQLITKTDLAKALNLWPGDFGTIDPASVCRGAQKAFSDFARNVSQKWSEKSIETVDGPFFRDCAAKIIIFRETERIVGGRPWYQGGYRAQVVAYAIAKLAFDLRERGLILRFDDVWAKQGLPDDLREALVVSADAAQKVIVNPVVTGQNISEWAKQSACWTRVQQLHVDWPVGLESCVRAVSEAREIKASVKKERKELNGIEAQMAVLELGHAYWQALSAWPQARKLFLPSESGAIAAASRPGSLPSEGLSRLAMAAHSKAIDAGFRR